MSYLYGGINAISMGTNAGSTLQSTSAVAIGYSAGQTNQGSNAIAIGSYAGQINQPTSSIVINATGTTFSGSAQNACYVAPLRNIAASTMMLYDSVNKEIVYSNLLNATITANGLNYSTLSGKAIATSTINTSTIVFSDGQTQQSSALGYGQIYKTYTSVTRAFNTAYTNTTGRPIYISITVSFQGATNQGTGYAESVVNTVAVTWNQVFVPVGTVLLVPISFIVPTGGTYTVYAANSNVGGSNAAVTLYTWAELS